MVLPFWLDSCHLPGVWILLPHRVRAGEELGLPQELRVPALLGPDQQAEAGGASGARTARER